MRRRFGNTDAKQSDLGFGGLDGPRAVDALFKQREDAFSQGVHGKNKSACTVCGQRHSPRQTCRFRIDGVESLPHHPERNGEYKGTATVRTLPLGVSGADLYRARHGKLEKPKRIREGQVWLDSWGTIWLVKSVNPDRITIICGDNTQVKTTAQALLNLGRWRFLSDGRGHGSLDQAHLGVPKARR